MELALNPFLQTRDGEDFRIQAFDRQEHDCEVCGVRHLNILLPDILGLVQDSAFQTRS